MSAFQFLPTREICFGFVLAVSWIIVPEGNAQNVKAPKDRPGPLKAELRITPKSLEVMGDKIEAYRRENKIPSVTVAVVRKGRIVFEKGFGWARLKEKAPATPSTQYAIGSVSKALTAAGLMRLVEQGLIDLDGPVNDYLGETPLRSAVGDPTEITVRHVATHSAGLATYWHLVNDKDPLGIPSRAEQIAQYGVAMTLPGERHVYSNLGYAVIARVIELRAGMPFENYMQREILEPLGMIRTTMGAQPAGAAATKYSGDDGRTGLPVPDKPGLPLANYTALSLASGHYYSTAHDLARFAIFNLHHPLEGGRAPLTHATLSEMHRPTVYQLKYIGQAIAWETVENESGVLSVEHAGGGPGMRARLELFPQDDFAIVLLVNDTRLYTFIGIKRLILEELYPGFYRYRASLFDFPLESNTANETTDTPAENPNVERQKARWLAAARNLAAEWDAQIGGPSRNHPITMTIKETGDVFVDFDKVGLPCVLTRTQMSSTGIEGHSLGSVNLKFPWRNAPHYVHLKLEITDGQIRGRVEFRSVASMAENSPYSHYFISLWVKFQRRGSASSANSARF